MFKSCMNEIKKRFLSPSFWVGLLVTILCMTTNAYCDMLNGKNYTVFEALTTLPAQVRRTQLSAYTIFTQGLNNAYAGLFLPMAVSVSFVPLLCVERKSGALRYQLVRGF